MARRLPVVVCQGQNNHPKKRQLEEDLVTALMLQDGVDVSVIPHLYDVQSDSTSALALQGISGDFVVFSWLYERASRWTLDRLGVQGQHGLSPLNDQSGASDSADEGEDDRTAESPSEDSPAAVAVHRTVPQRRIYCIELTAADSADDFVAEVQRIHRQVATEVVQLDSWMGDRQGVSPEARQRFQQPTNDTALNADGQLDMVPTNGRSDSAAEVRRIDDKVDRRWYPVIDFARCTNCMECIDFCLFGVYGIDSTETILVEQPDNCRKGCPACSRVCPENAIIFPQHKSPAIAGALGDIGSMKIDLSRLFGAPDAVELAAQERDEQLMLAGREAVGSTDDAARRQAHAAVAPRDELDDLMDGLDELDL